MMDSSSDAGNKVLGFDELSLGCNVAVKAMVCRKWDAHNSFEKYLSTEFILSDSQPFNYACISSCLSALRNRFSMAVMAGDLSGPLDRFLRPGDVFTMEGRNDERKAKLGSFKKSAYSVSNRFKHSLRKGRRSSRVMSIVFEDEHDMEEVKVVDEFRQALILEELLSTKHDDYHLLLRFLKARNFEIEKSKQLWANMIQWRKDFGADTTLWGSDVSCTSSFAFFKLRINFGAFFLLHRLGFCIQKGVGAQLVSRLPSNFV